MSPKALRCVGIGFFLSILALVTFGFVMLASTSSAFARQGDAFFYAKRQAIWLGIGVTG